MNARLTEKEAEVYIFLAKHELLKVTEVARLLRKDKSQIFRILNILQTKGYVESTIEFPTRFKVVPLERILESIVKNKREEVAFIEEAKEDFLAYLRKKRQAEAEPSLEKFVIIKGKKNIDSRIIKLILRSKYQLSTVSTVQDLARADNLGFFDTAFNHPLRTQIKYRFLTEISKNNISSIKKLLKKTTKLDLSFKARNPDLRISLFPRMIIRDDEEILFLAMTKKDTTEKSDVCLWTNCKSLVQAFTSVFEDLWHNSTNIQERIAEIETGKQKPKTCIFRNEETAKKTYDEIVESVENEIVSMTSSEGIIRFSKSIQILKNWRKKGVTIRIMAPIIGENLKAAEQLSEVCTIKHVPNNYFESTIIDGKHFFQFKPSTKHHNDTNSTAHFENTFYTNDCDYVEKMKNAINDIWNNASTPSVVTLEEALKKSQKSIAPASYYRNPCYLRKVSGMRIEKWAQKRITTSKDVLNKIIDPTKFQIKNNPTGPLKLHGNMGSAAIHPPDYFNMPDIAISFFHAEKQSSFGEEDSMLIYLWLETQAGHSYVPVAYVGDNPDAQSLWKDMMATTPAGQNIRLVKKDEVQIRTHGNTLFAGWTKEIPLLSSKHILQPACILIEGYGQLKTDTYTMLYPSGHKIVVERNGCEAFVTFFHPKSKYSGPGTDGFFARDFVATTYPPSTPKNN